MRRSYSVLLWVGTHGMNHAWLKYGGGSGCFYPQQNKAGSKGEKKCGHLVAIWKVSGKETRKDGERVTGRECPRARGKS